jgi:hypothetical protein
MRGAALHLVQDLHVGAQDIGSGHSRLAGHAGRDDQEVGIPYGPPVRGPHDTGVETEQGRGLLGIQGGPFRDALAHIPQDQFPADILFGQEVCGRFSDPSGSHHGDFLHGVLPLLYDRLLG